MTDHNVFLDRRAAARVPLEIWVEQTTQRELYFQRGTNISSGGMFLADTVPYPRGEQIELRFMLPGDARAFQLVGEIVNVAQNDRALGMGLRFIGMKPDDSQRIARFVAQRCDGARRR